MTTPLPWQLPAPLDAIIFDCDGTLSSIEGVDELAKLNGVGEIVTSLTSAAMSKTGISPIIYQERLNLTRPTQSEITELGQWYFDQRAPEVIEVISTLKRLHKSVYIVSAGLLPAVKIFGEKLGVPAKHVFAVDIKFDSQGNYVNFDHNSPLTDRDGKREIVKQLKSTHPKLGFVGDGLNDLATRNDVARFVGYGGAYYRENIAERCEFYVCTLTMSPLLPLFLTHEESKRLLPAEKNLYDEGLEAIKSKRVIIKDKG